MGAPPQVLSGFRDGILLELALTELRSADTQQHITESDGVSRVLGIKVCKVDWGLLASVPDQTLVECSATAGYMFGCSLLYQVHPRDRQFAQCSDAVFGHCTLVRCCLGLLQDVHQYIP